MLRAKPLNILFLTYQGDVAGSTHSIAYLSKGLAHKGHNIYVGIRRESLLWSLLDNSKVKRVAMTFRGKFDFENWRQIRDVVQEYNIQIINAQSSHDRYTSIFSRWRYGLNTKIIHTRRQMPLSIKNPVQNYLYNQRTDGIVAVSKQVAKGLVNIGIKPSQIEVIYNGTPREKYEHINDSLTAQLKSDLKINEDDFVIGCVSRPKNQIQIIEALTLLKQPVTMIFCGLEATEEMNQIINNYKLEHTIHFIGQVEGKDVLSYYGLFDLKILASTMEGLSQSLLEAMALGIPVIGTAFAGNLDLIEDGENGLFFKDGDIQTLSEQIKKLRNSKELRSKLSKAGKETALEKFSIENTIRNYEEYFYKLIED